MASLGRVFIVGTVALTITACGPLGDDDPDPTAPPTATLWPTVVPADDITPSADESTPWQFATTEATPAVSETDAAATPSAPEASPATSEDGETTAVVDLPAMEVPGWATPETAVIATSTTGVEPTATSAPAETPEDSSTATPAATPDGTPSASVSEVTSCDPDEVPAFTGDAPEYITTADLNFRAGPGSDCDMLDGPLVAGALIEVTSDPVTRDTDPGIEWVQINVGGAIGWVSTDFLEPAP